MKQIKYRKLTHVMENKALVGFRAGAERNAWIVVDGKKATRVTIPKIHSGDIPVGTVRSIQSQLSMSEPDFMDFVDCPMSGAQFADHMRTLL